MSITDVRTINRSAQVNEEGKLTVTRVFAVLTNDDDDGPLTVLGNCGVVYGQSYLTDGESDSGLKARNFTVTNELQDDGQREWTVTIVYSSPDSEDDEPNPLNQPIQVSLGFANFSEPMEQTPEGEAVVNSAGMPFNEAVERDDPRPILTIKRNEATYNEQLAYAYRRAVNADAWRGYPAGTVKVASIQAERVYNEQYGAYYEVTYSFELNPTGFDAVVLDQGKYEKQGAELVPIKVKGKQVDEPVLLDGQGQKNAANAPPYFLRFQRYELLPFSAFNF